MKVCPFAHWGVVSTPVLLDSWMCKPSLSWSVEVIAGKKMLMSLYLVSVWGVPRPSAGRFCRRWGLSVRAAPAGVRGCGRCHCTAWCRCVPLCSPSGCRPDGHLVCASGPRPGSALQARAQQLIKNLWWEIDNQTFFSNYFGVLNTSLLL